MITSLRNPGVHWSSFRIVALAAGLCCLGEPAAGQSGLPRLDKIRAADGAASDQFGISVSVSGDVAVVGAIGDDDLGSSSGSAYVYRFNGTTWVQEQKLTADDGAADDRFGTSVSVSGDVALVGASGDDDNGSSSGSAYVYRFNGSSWVQEQNLLAADGAAGDQFGISVSVSGDVAVVGAFFDSDNGNFSGSAYVYRLNGSFWVQEQKLTADDGAAQDQFGISVSVSGDVAVVGADFDDDLGSSSGSAYVYRFNGRSWGQEQKLTAADGAAQDRFGISVAVSGDVAVVGAFFDDDLGSNSGSAYVYRFSGSTWVQEQKLTADDGAADDQFGRSVSVSGDVAVVGAVGDDDLGSSSGSAYVYRFNGSAWVREQKLTAADGAASDFFGASVSVSGEVALLGAFGDDDLGSSSGSAYVGDLRYLRLGVDCDGNGTADIFDLLEGTAADCNGNLIPDSCDIASGSSLDANGNGIPDECEVQTCPGDTNGDGAVDVDDLIMVILNWGGC